MIHMTRTDLIERLESEVKSIQAKDKVAILHHADADGTCSAVIIAKAIEKLTGKKPETVIALTYAEGERYNKVLPKLQKEKPDYVIIVDVSLDIDPKFFQEIEEFARIIFIDHHKIYNDLNSGKIIYIKAQYISDIEPSKYCAAKMCFDLFGKIVPLPECSWVACLGILGDNGVEAWKGFVEESLSENNMKLPDLDKLMDVVSSVEVVAPDKFNELFSEIYNSKKPQALFNSSLLQYKKIYDSEMEKLLREFKEKAEIDKNLELILFEFTSKYEIKSSLANKITNEFYPGMTLIVIQDKGDNLLRFSGRRQDFKVKVNELLEKACQGIEGAGAGGHIPAAAGKMNKADLGKFKENLRSILKSGAVLNK